MARGCRVFTKIIPKPSPPCPCEQPKTRANDIFVHALFARLALSDNSTIEFSTVYDQSTNTIELDIPDAALPYLDQITGIQRGPRFKQYVDWLIGSKTIAETAAKDADFVGATMLQSWYGAEPINPDGSRFLLSLPMCDASSIGYNLKTGCDFHGKLEVKLMWMFLDGNNTSFDIRTSATISDSSGGSPVSLQADTNISTVNLIPYDIRETTILDTGNIVGGNSIITLLLNRNWPGSSDPKTESVGVVGLRLNLVDDGA